MPESVRLFQIQGQENGANDNQRKGDPESDSGNLLVLSPSSHQVDERGHEISAGSDSAQKEVADDPPAPVGIGNENVHSRTSR